MLKVNSANLVHLFLKFNVIFGLTNQISSYLLRPISTLLSSQFVKPTWFFYKKIIVRKFGLYSNNLIKSYIHHTVGNLGQGLSLRYTSNRPEGFTRYVTYYSRPISMFNFPFHKKTYNTFIFFIIALLLDSYTSVLNHFHLYYSFIFIKSNMYFLSALNNYYLKIHNH